MYRQNDATVTLEDRSEALCASLRCMGKVLVMFSGGVDSALLAHLAHSVLGENTEAITVDSLLTTSQDRCDAPEVAKSIGINHSYIKVDELSNPDFVLNDPMRCYYCKKMRLRMVIQWAHLHGYDHILDGSNADDLNDYRPGFEAIKECSAVHSPLLDFGFTKNDVRELSKRVGLSTWKKPSGACLASRIASNMHIDITSLSMVDAAESYIADLLPLGAQLRVRHHGDIARIEADPLCSKILLSAAEKVCEVLRTIGYRYVTLDLRGYVMGSCNDGVNHD